MKSNVYPRRNTEELYINENNIINYSKQKELEKQVLTGEITPFTAIEQSNLTITKGYKIYNNFTRKNNKN